jgi:hypothetical protein
VIVGSKLEPSLTLNLTGDDVDTFIQMMKTARDGKLSYLYDDLARSILIELGENSYDEY